MAGDEKKRATERPYAGSLEAVIMNLGAYLEKGRDAPPFITLTANEANLIYQALTRDFRGDSRGDNISVD